MTDAHETFTEARFSTHHESTEALDASARRRRAVCARVLQGRSRSRGVVLLPDCDLSRRLLRCVRRAVSFGLGTEMIEKVFEIRGAKKGDLWENVPRETALAFVRGSYPLDEHNVFARLEEGKLDFALLQDGRSVRCRERTVSEKC